MNGCNGAELPWVAQFLLPAKEALGCQSRAQQQEALHSLCHLVRDSEMGVCKSPVGEALPCRRLAGLFILAHTGME